jgi:hypothetical protein
MESTAMPPRASSGRGRLVAAATVALVLVGLGSAVYLVLQSDQREFDRRQAVRRSESVEKVRAGDDGSGITIFDPLLLEMLASDTDCVANLTTLCFSMADLSSREVASAGKLVNVKKIVFYSCHGADDVLTAMQGLPSVEELYFEVSGISDDGVRRLAAFPNLRNVRFEQVIDEQREDLLRETLPGVVIEIPYPEANEPPH